QPRRRRPAGGAAAAAAGLARDLGAAAPRGRGAGAVPPPPPARGARALPGLVGALGPGRRPRGAGDAARGAGAFHHVTLVPTLRVGPPPGRSASRPWCGAPAARDADATQSVAPGGSHAPRGNQVALAYPCAGNLCASASTSASSTSTSCTRRSTWW